MGQGRIIFLIKDGNLAVNRELHDLNAGEISQIIAHLEIVKSEFIEIIREMIKK